MPFYVTDTPASSSAPVDLFDASDWKSALYNVPTDLYINGSWRESSDGSSISVENPATAQTLAHIASATTADGTAALDAAVAASDDRVRTSPRHRAELLHRAFDMLTVRADHIATSITLEMGTPFPQACGEVSYGAEFTWASTPPTLLPVAAHAKTPGDMTDLRLEHASVPPPQSPSTRLGS